jgi:hypothetical protein
MIEHFDNASGAILNLKKKKKKKNEEPSKNSGVDNRGRVKTGDRIAS